MSQTTRLCLKDFQNNFSRCNSFHLNPPKIFSEKSDKTCSLLKISSFLHQTSEKISAYVSLFLKQKGPLCRSRTSQQQKVVVEFSSLMNSRGFFKSAQQQIQHLLIGRRTLVATCQSLTLQKQSVGFDKCIKRQHVTCLFMLVYLKRAESGS